MYGMNREGVGTFYIGTYDNFSVFDQTTHPPPGAFKKYQNYFSIFGLKQPTLLKKDTFCDRNIS